MSDPRLRQLQPHRATVQSLMRVLSDADLDELDIVAVSARRILNTSCATIALVDGTLTRFLTNVGFDHAHLANARMFEAAATTTEPVFVVPDAAADARFAGSDLVVKAPWTRAFIGAPLALSDGARVGCLCAFDPKPNRALSRADARLLFDLVERAQRVLERAADRAALSETGPSDLTPPPHPTPEAQRALATETPGFHSRHLRAIPRAAHHGVVDIALLQRVIDTNPNPVFIKDERGVFVLANVAGASLFGVTVDELLGQRERDLAGAEAEEEISGAFARVPTDVLGTSTPRPPVEQAFVDAAGRTRWFEVHRQVLALEPGGGPCVLTIARDVTELRAVKGREAAYADLMRSVSSPKRLEDILVNVAEYVEALLDNVMCVIWRRDERDIRVSMSDAVPTDLADRIRWRECSPAKLPTALPASREEPLYFGPIDGSDACSPYLRMSHHGLDQLLSLPICSPAGTVVGALDILPVVGFSDLDETREVAASAVRAAGIAIMHRQAKSALRFRTQYDSVTHLPNRYELETQATRAVKHGRRNGTNVAVMHIALDRFLAIRETRGQEEADALLRSVVQRFEGVLRETDTLARLEGPEFAAVLTDIRDAAGTTRVAQKLLAALEKPFEVLDWEVTLDASIGVAMFPQDGTDAATLIRHANAAMSRARASRGSAPFHYFSTDMHTAAVDRLNLENALRKAVDNREFTLWLQPQLNIRTGRPAGFEALARWKLGEQYVPPGEFIPLAEETRMIWEIGFWALLETCRMARRWLDEGGRPVTFGVNVSPQQLERDDFVELVAKSLARFDVPPRMLELEITETAMMNEVDAVIPRLHALRNMGVGIAIDDFGTGYANLVYLQRLPITRLKVDRAFVMAIQDLPEQPDRNAEIVEFIVDWAHRFDLEVVAEGVEEPHQLAFLRNIGAEVAQGWVYHRAMPVDEAFAAARTGS